MEKPLLSVVTPVYNGSKYLEEMIESVLQQTYPNIEHYIIDDGSTDGGKSVEILKKYPHLRWRTHENMGQYATQNVLFREAKGEWITCNGQDDRYYDKYAFEAVADHALSHPNADVIHGVTRLVDEDGSLGLMQAPQKFPYWTLQYCLTIRHCSLFVRKSAMVEKDIFFNEQLKYTGDADWTFRLQLAGLKFSLIDRYISDYRHHPTQLTTIADRNPEAWKARNLEHKRLATLYGPNPLLRRIVMGWVNFEKRKQVARLYLKGYRRVDNVWLKP